MKSIKKRTGSYYTPDYIAKFIINRLEGKCAFKKNISILEPSAGDGIFVKQFQDSNFFDERIKKITAVELDKSELDKIDYSNEVLEKVHSDFLEFQNNNEQKFSIVVGNPPYIKTNLLTLEQKIKCQKIHVEANLSKRVPNNIWSSFFVRAINFLKEDGVFAFILPSDLLQVSFALELRKYLFYKFERIEIFTFSELLFKDCKNQDTIVVFGERKSEKKGVYFTRVNNSKNLIEGKFKLKKTTISPEEKWNHLYLSTHEIDFLKKIKENINSVSDYCISRPGIVTGANDYFIVDEKKVKNFSLSSYVSKIIQKGLFINGKVTFDDKDFDFLASSLKPAFLLSLKNKKINIRNNKLRSYLQIGIDNEVNLRYKTSKREKWFEVPISADIADGFFFKRSHNYPKLIKNNANVLVTDSAYLINMKDGYDINSFIYSYYNSFTLIYAEIVGRFYGGGVLELTPKEFKMLPLPYVDITSEDFNLYSKVFKKKGSIEEICKLNDEKILTKNIEGLKKQDLENLRKIRKKLYSNRMKKFNL